MIRLNQDVVVYDETRLKRLMSQPSVYGVFSNCLDTYCDKYATRSCRESKDFSLMTDLFAFRPDEAHYDRWFNTSIKKHPETWCSHSFKPIMESGNFAWLQSYANTSACRIQQEDIVHSHQKWTLRLDSVIAGRRIRTGAGCTSWNTKPT